MCMFVPVLAENLKERIPMVKARTRGWGCGVEVETHLLLHSPRCRLTTLCRMRIQFAIIMQTNVYF